LADDVGADEDGNTYVTDVLGSKIWKVSPDGEPLSIIKNATFIQRPGAWNNLIGLNGIIYHPNGYLLVIHTTGGDLFKVEPRTGAVSVVKVLGSLKRGDGLELLSGPDEAGRRRHADPAGRERRRLEDRARHRPVRRAGAQGRDFGDGEGRGRVRQLRLRIRAREEEDARHW
jgi:sugar lactone lactonase YvrE